MEVFFTVCIQGPNVQVSQPVNRRNFWTIVDYINLRFLTFASLDLLSFRSRAGPGTHGFRVGVGVG